MSEARMVLLMALVMCVFQAHAASRFETTAQVIAILKHGIQLNEQFKQSLESSEDTRYRSLRRELEQYDEGTAMPCLLRAEALMRGGQADRAMIRTLMEFAVSHENLADERASRAVAVAFAVHPRTVEREWKTFSTQQRRILYRSIDAGWAVARKPLFAVQRRDREARLALLRNPDD